MFDIGAVELMVIGIVAIIVVGPKDLPGMLRTFGQFVSKMRGMAREFQTTFEEAAKDTGIDEIAKGVSDVKSFSPTSGIGKVFDPIKEETEALKSDIESAGKKKTSPASAAKPATKKTAAKKPAAKKTAAKKTAAKKPAPKKAATKKPVPKKAPVKKPAPRKVAAKSAPKRAKPAASAKS